MVVLLEHEGPLTNLRQGKKLESQPRKAVRIAEAFFQVLLFQSDFI